MGFKKLSKAVRKNPRILTIAALPKEGKTTALAGIDNVLIVDCDANDGTDYLDPESIGKEPTIYKCSTLENWKELVSLLKSAKESAQGKNPFKVIVIDTINLAYEHLAEDMGLVIENQVRKLEGKPPASRKIFNSLPYGKAWLAKAQAMNRMFDTLSNYCDTVIIAGHLIAVDHEGQQVLTINLPGKLKEKLPGLATANASMRVNPEDSNERILTFAQDLNTIAGSRIPRLAGKEFVISKRDPKTGKFTFFWNEVFVD